MRVGFGVVVTTTRGSVPSRSPNISMSQASGYRHEAISSHHAASCCGPRNLSGSSAEYVVATAPFGHVRRRFDGSYRGRSQSGEMAMMPLSPSTMTSRTSAAVGPTSAIRFLPLAISWRTHSAPVRVLPKPRPASRSHVRQSPRGASWRGLAQKDQSNSSCTSSSSLRSRRIAARSGAGITHDPHVSMSELSRIRRVNAYSAAGPSKQ
jgi:hypothetical protein